MSLVAVSSPVFMTFPSGRAQRTNIAHGIVNLRLTECEIIQYRELKNLDRNKVWSCQAMIHYVGNAFLTRSFTFTREVVRD